MTIVGKIILHAYSVAEEPAIDIAYYSFPVQQIYAEINITYISVAGYGPINGTALSKQWIAGVRIRDYTLLIPVITPPYVQKLNILTPKEWSKTSILTRPFLCAGVTFALLAKFCEVYARGTIFSL